MPRFEFMHSTMKASRWARAAVGFDTPTTLYGITAGQVSVYLSSAIAADLGAQACARTVFNMADGLMDALATLFGVPKRPLNVIVTRLSGSGDGTGGAYHYGCDFTTGGDLYLDVCLNEPAFDMFLFVAEASECFMGAQGAGWACGGSNGEALSRWCAETLVPGTQTAQLFASTPTWVADGMPDWVDSTEGTDQDPDSFGCGLAYLYWVTELLGQAPSTVIRAGGATLAENFAGLGLTGDAYSMLVAAVNAQPGFSGDDPFAGSVPAPAPAPSPSPSPTPPPPPPSGNAAAVAQIVALAQQIIDTANTIT